MAVAAILAGGRATRMGGGHKPLLTVGGTSILARQLAVLRPLFDEVLLVTGDAPAYAGRGVRVVADLRPGEGPLAGLEAALAASDGESLFLVGGDMPLLSPGAIALVMSFAPDAAAAAPYVGGLLEPLHARYARRAQPRVSARLDAGERSLVGLLEELAAARVDEATLRRADPGLHTLANLNTPEELAALDALVRRAPP